MTLRPYQTRMLDETRNAIRQGHQGVLMVAPTGSGKGTIATEICHGAQRHGSRIIFLVNRKELVKDMSRRLDRLGLDHGIIMADHPRRKPAAHVHIASIDTLHRRPGVPPADILIMDEAHFAVSPVWFKIVDRYPNAVRIGMTATPCRLDGKGLGHRGMFTHMVLGPSVAELIAEGNLASYRAFGCAAPPAMEGVGISRATHDYNQKQLGEAVRKPTIVGDIVSHWMKLAASTKRNQAYFPNGEFRAVDMPTVVFAVDIAHSEMIRDQFRAAGVAAESADADTPSDERDRLWESLSSGRVQVVCSVGIVSYGWDVPAVRCCVLARPTQSLALSLQQIGRVLRPHPDKPYALILDHAGNLARHGLPDDPREWSLESGVIQHKTEKEDKEPPIRMCEKCLYLYPATTTTCPECGHVNAKKGREVKQVDGELAEIVPVRYYRCDWCSVQGRLPEGLDYASDCPACGFGPLRPLASKYDCGEGASEKRQKYIQWFLDGTARGYKPTWAAMKFKQIYGTWPARAWREEAEKRVQFQELAS